MVYIPDKVKRIIKRYVKELKKNNIPIDEMILFGSYAKGNYNEYSDIDLLIVSPIFKGDRIEDRDKIRKITLKVSSEIEVLPCSREEFKEKNPFIKDIIKTGIRINIK